MAIPIDENILLFIAGALFIPLFGFLIKMIIEMSSNRAKFKTYDDHIEESKEWKKEINELLKTKSVADLRLNNIETDIKELYRRRYDQQYHDQQAIKGGESEEGHDRR